MADKEKFPSLNGVRKFFLRPRVLFDIEFYCHFFLIDGSIKDEFSDSGIVIEDLIKERGCRSWDRLRRYLQIHFYQFMS